MVIDVLLDPVQTNVLMQNLSHYIVYIYPGIISIYIYNFLNAKTTYNTQAFIIKSFAISYMYNMLLRKIGLLIKLNGNGIGYNIILVIISFLLPYCWYHFLRTPAFRLIRRILKISTSVIDVPFEILKNDGEKYTCLKVYLKNAPYAYVGYMQQYEYESNCERFVILSGYKKYHIGVNSEEFLLLNNKAEHHSEKVFIKFEDIKVIEKIDEERAKCEIYGK